MVLDTEEQKILLLDLFNNASFNGLYIEKAYTLKEAIYNAEVASVEVEKTERDQV